MRVIAQEMNYTTGVFTHYFRNIDPEVEFNALLAIGNGVSLDALIKPEDSALNSKNS
ncbi:MAG: hypothetical protein AAFQ63_10150 [Cyanobacteria bacterium J06621_11]